MAGPRSPARSPSPWGAKAPLAILFLAACCLALAPASGARAEVSAGGERQARMVVERLQSVMLEAMKGGSKLGFEGRRALLAPVLRSAFDLPYIARIVLGRHWDGLEEGQRERFLETFTRLVEAIYAGELDDWQGETFSIVQIRPLRGERLLVRSEVLEPDGDVDRLDYVLHRVEDEWRIVNVLADGVSDLALKRAEYDAIIGREGFDALLSKIAGQIENYRRGSAAGEGRVLPGRADGS